MVKCLNTRKRWTDDENQKLEELIMMNGTTKNGWKATVEALKSLNYERSIKACKERYLNHSTKRNLTTFKFQDLIEHLKISGNKWSEIAKKMNMSNRQVKNSFYSHVKQVLRRLIQSTYQDQSASRRTQNIKPKLLSSMFQSEECSIKIPYREKHTFQQLILENEFMNHNQVLDHKIKQQRNKKSNIALTNSKNDQNNNTDQIIMKNIQEKGHIFKKPMLIFEKEESELVFEVIPDYISDPYIIHFTSSKINNCYPIYSFTNI